MQAKKVKNGQKVRFCLENISLIESLEVRESFKQSLIDRGLVDGEKYLVIRKYRDKSCILFDLEIDGKKRILGSYLFEYI
jgi:hypothetical protein